MHFIEKALIDAALSVKLKRAKTCIKYDEQPTHVPFDRQSQELPTKTIIDVSMGEIIADLLAESCIFDLKA